MVSVKERIAAENAAAQERAARAEKFGSRRTSSGDVPWPPGTTTPLRSGSLSRAASGTQPSPAAALAEATVERVPSPPGLPCGQGMGAPMPEARGPSEETLSQAAAARSALLQAFDAKAQAPGAAAPSEGAPQTATARAALLRAFDAAASGAVREAPGTGAIDAGSQAATARAALQRAFQADNTGAAAIRSAVADGAMTESQAAAARSALTEAFDAGKAAAAGGPAARETGTQAAEARAALLKAFHASEQAAARPAAPDAAGVQAAAARAALQAAFARSSSLRSSSEDQQVVLSSEAAAHAAAARAAVHEVVVKGEKEAAEAAALPQLEQMRSAAGFTGRLSPSRASAGVHVRAPAPAAEAAAAESQGLAAADLPGLPERTRGQPPGAADFLWDTVPAAEQGQVAGAVSGLQHEPTSSQTAEAQAALQHTQQPGSAALQQPRSQAQQGPGSAPVLLAASTAGQDAGPSDAQSAEPEHTPAAAEAAAHSPLATDFMPEPLTVARSHAEKPTELSMAAKIPLGLQPHEGAADLAAGGNPAEGWPQAALSASPAAAHPAVVLSSSKLLLVETPQPQADTGGKAAASGFDDWREDAFAGAKAPEPASGRSYKPAGAAAGASHVAEALSSAAVIPDTAADAGASHRQGADLGRARDHHQGAAAASDPHAAAPDPGSAAEAGLGQQADAAAGSKSPASSEHSWGADAFAAPQAEPADAPEEDQVPDVAGSLGNAEVGPAHAEAAAEPSAATEDSLPAPEQAGSSPAAAQAAQLGDEWGEDAFAAAEAPAGGLKAAGPSAAAGHAEAAAEPSASVGESLLAPQAAGGSPTAAQDSLAVQLDDNEWGEDAFAAAEAPETMARARGSPTAAGNLPAQQAATSGQGSEPSEGSGALARGTAAASSSESVPEGDIGQAAAADAAAEHKEVPAEEAAEDDWAEDDFVAGEALPEHNQAAAEPLPAPPAPGEAAPAAGSAVQTPRAAAVSEIEPAEAEEQEDWGDDDGFGDFNDAANASALEQEAGPAASARPPSPHQPAAPAQPASSAAQPAAAGGAVDLLSLEGPDYEAAVRQLLYPLTAAHQTLSPEARTSQQGEGDAGSDALRQEQTSEEAGDGRAQGGRSKAGAGGRQAGVGGRHRAARPLQELLQQHAGLGLLGTALRRAGLLEAPALTTQQSAEMRAACLPRLAWKGCAAEQRLLGRLGLAEAARQAEVAAQEQVRQSKKRRTSSGRLGSAPSGERQSGPPTLGRDSSVGLASAGSFTSGPGEQQGQLLSAGTADLDLDYFDTLGLASGTKAQPARPSQPPPAQLAPPPSSTPAAPPRLPDTAAASSRTPATGSSTSAPQQPSSALGTERAGSAGWEFPAWGDSTATQTPQAASSGRMRAPESSASSAKTPVPEPSASSAGREHTSSSTSAAASAAGGSAWQVDWDATAFQAAQAAQADEESPAPQQPSQAASLDPFAASLTLTPAAAAAGAAGNDWGDFGGTRAAETGSHSRGQQSHAETPSGRSQAGNSDWGSEGFGDFAQASPAGAGPPEAAASQGSRLQAATFGTPPAEDPFAASTGLQPSPGQESGMAASANGPLQSPSPQEHIVAGLPIPDLSYMLSPELVLPSPS